MNKIILQKDSKKYPNDYNVNIKEIDEKFHGKLTIHFANGIPRKVETNKVEDIITLS